MSNLNLDGLDCTMTWGEGEVVLRLDGHDWQLGVARECDAALLAEVARFLERVGITVDEDDSGHDIDENGVVWWVLASDEVSFWKE